LKRFGLQPGAWRGQERGSISQPELGSRRVNALYLANDHALGPLMLSEGCQRGEETQQDETQEECVQRAAARVLPCRHGEILEGRRPGVYSAFDQIMQAQRP